MKSYHLVSQVTVSATTVVKANSLAEAIAESKERDVALGGLGRGVEETDTWVIEDADGSPTGIHEA
jgi:hypothetical protein